MIHNVWSATLGRLLTAILVVIIRVYQLILSPLLGARCRYYPSCSSFGLSAITQHGPIKGTLLTVWRILRCNPWSPGGVDFVPSGKAWRNKEVIEFSTNTKCHGVSV